jgi:hypothetical protein
MRIVSTKISSIINQITSIHTKLKINEYHSEIEYYLEYRRIFENDEKIDDILTHYFKYLLKFDENTSGINTWSGWILKYTLGVRDTLYNEYTTRVKSHYSDSIPDHIELLEEIIKLINLIMEYRVYVSDTENIRLSIIKEFENILGILPSVDFGVTENPRDYDSLMLLLKDTQNTIQNLYIPNFIYTEDFDNISIVILNRIHTVKYLLHRNLALTHE